MPQLSFVLPVYKPNTQYLLKCINSLRKQSLQDYEAIFVMDGDDDATYRFLSKNIIGVCNSKIVIIPHGGACAARNAGFEHTSSPYVVFFDSDCEIEVDAAKAWVDILDRQTEFGFVYSGYKFFEDDSAIASEPFDPWLLRVNNYISTCFPFRRELFTKWDESLESLQDWDFWLTMVEKGAKGKFLIGYGFSTALPSANSISGKGCTDEVWLERMDKVKKKHGIPDKTVCVTSVHNKNDAIMLAKLIDADYRDVPNYKPNHYKKIIQVGFSIHPQFAERHASLWDKHQEKVIYWTKEDVEELYNSFALAVLKQYVNQLSKVVHKQYVEDKRGKDILEECGFKAEILPFPLLSDGIEPMPTRPSFLVDCSQKYGHVLGVVKEALPDVHIEIATGMQNIADYCGLISFYPDRIMGLQHKRMALNGRHIISNINSPYMGFLDDYTSDEKFIVNLTSRVRQVMRKAPNLKASEYYANEIKKKNYVEAL